MEALSEYEKRERHLLDKQLSALEDSPRHEKRSDTARYIEILQNDLPLFRERLAWLANGSYGRGAYTLIRQWIEQAKTGRKKAGEPRPRWIVGSILALLGAVEWSAPQSYTVRYWKSLSPEQWQAIADTVNRELDEIENENRE
jgi:hypothetical protein